jgi:hypothetical protein
VDLNTVHGPRKLISLGSTSSDDDILRGIRFYSLPLPSGSFPINCSLIIF